MEERKYRYDAFISYRHTELDRFVAENLIKQLESYKLPKSVAKKLKGNKTKIERVFRDREELPLTNNLEEPIVDALMNSEWLIVVCSPRLPESMWCKKEIETFISLRGREHVLAVLIEGEPAESFPEELLYRIDTIQNPDGTIQQIRVPIEPLAADFRGEGKKGVAKAMKTEILRILAAMFGVPFDDLRQRHRERRMRRIATASLVIGTACLLFGIYSTMTAMRIKAQKEQIEVQAGQIMEQSEEIQKQNQEITKQNQELAIRQARSLAELATSYYEEGDNKNAAKTAVEALTESDGISLPYTPEAQYILTNSIRAYDIGDAFRADYQYEVAGRIEDITLSPDGNTLAIYDATGVLTLFDMENRREIKSFSYELSEFLGVKKYRFLADNCFAYVDREGYVCIYDIEENAVRGKIPQEDVTFMYTDEKGSYLLTSGLQRMYTLYDGATQEKILELQQPKSMIHDMKPFVFEEGILADSYYTKDEEDHAFYTIYFYDLLKGEEISNCYLGEKEVTDVKIMDGVAYIMSAQYAEGYVTCDTYVTAVSVGTGELLWEDKLQGEYAKMLKLPIKDQGTDLLAVTGGNARLVNMQTGEITYIVSLDSKILRINNFSNDNKFLLLLENGGLSVVSKEDMTCFDMSYLLECKSLKNENAYYTKYGMVFQAKNDKRITFYTQKMGQGVKESEQIVDAPESEMKTYGDKAIEAARSYEVEKPEFVKGLYYSEDQRYCMMYYWDGSLSIYDTVNKQVVNSIKEAYDTDICLGTDKEGITYLLGAYGCYLLDKDMKPVAFIPYAKDVDLEKRIIYMEKSNVCYEANVYTVEELLQMAENM